MEMRRTGVRADGSFADGPLSRAGGIAEFGFASLMPLA
jgi:hypothetical protein